MTVNDSMLFKYTVTINYLRRVRDKTYKFNRYVGNFSISLNDTVEDMMCYVVKECIKAGPKFSQSVDQFLSLVEYLADSECFMVNDMVLE